MLPEFVYSYNDGPRSKNSINKPIEKGNCRLAVQIYFCKIYNHFIDLSLIHNVKFLLNIKKREFLFSLTNI